ncbi:MAG: HAD family hydrolase [Actinomycetota bacterium]|nr:HAD family hydrolase [Actinomycetota bacterium]
MPGPLDRQRPEGDTVAAVAFDVGETLIDETRLWSRWADRLGVPRLTFLGVLGGVAALGRPHRDAFEMVRPRFDLHVELERWAQDDPSGLRENFDADDLYPDVRASFAHLRDRGLGVIIAGNQPSQAKGALEAMDLGADAILISDELGFAKPDPRFFVAVAEAAGLAPSAVAYVGDRVDNDVIPARDAGMIAVLVRRGPWGHLHAEWPEAAAADHIIESLAGLADLLAPPRP